jgi:hypothetical protein
MRLEQQKSLEFERRRVLEKASEIRNEPVDVRWRFNRRNAAEDLGEIDPLPTHSIAPSIGTSKGQFSF